MELTAELSGEKIPSSSPSNSKITFSDANDNLKEQHSKDDIENNFDKLETLLLNKIQKGNDECLFLLAQLYFESEQFEKSTKYFERSSEKGNLQATFQLAVLHYDHLTSDSSPSKAVRLMRQVSENKDPNYQHLIWAAKYNLGRAYYQGYGIDRSEADAEKFWLQAAGDGSPKASVKAQSTLGLFYARSNLKKSFFWHSEACGNGSLESQGALGVMHLFGIGTKRNSKSAFICLREASDRGNVYAMGSLVGYYYKYKLYVKAVDLASRVSQLERLEDIAEETDCLPTYIAKGISLACFYYARCLHKGRGVNVDEKKAEELYVKSFQFDPHVCAQLQKEVQHGLI